MGNCCKKISLILVALTMLTAPQAWAVRPFITDDAALIGFKRTELATWTFMSNGGTELWHSANIGLANWCELTISGLWGFSKVTDNKGFSYSLPLLQTKLLARSYEPNGLPGVAFAFGGDIPWGKGAFVPGGYGAFAFGAVTQCFGEDENVLIHANIGSTYFREEKKNLTGLTWGIGTQVKVYKGLHGIAEIVSGDPYVHGAGMAYQFGARYFINDFLQCDLAFGKGIGNDNRTASWITGGIRYVVSFDRIKK